MSNGASRSRVVPTSSNQVAAICRDLILPCVYALAQFIESVEIEEKNT
jgi:hypothetical protein